MRIRGLCVVSLAVAVVIPASSPASALTPYRRAVVPYENEARSTAALYAADCSTGAVIQRAETGISGPAPRLRVAFRPRRAERKVAIEIFDDLPGQQVITVIESAGIRTVVCGESRRIAVRRGYPISVELLTGVSERGPSRATTGYVHATFYR